MLHSTSSADANTFISTPPVGRDFVLGLPDRSGQYRIFMNGAVWLIASGNYGPGERVYVVGAENNQLMVQRGRREMPDNLPPT